MKSQTARISICLLLSVLTMAGARGQFHSQERTKHSASPSLSRAQSQSKSAIKQARASNTLRVHAMANPPATKIGLSTATQIPAGVACSGVPNCATTTSLYPAVLGDFLGNGSQEVAASVQTYHPRGSAISVEVPAPSGGFPFTPTLTASLSTSTTADLIIVGKLNSTDTKDSVIMFHYPPAYEAFVNSNGDGTFTSQGSKTISAITSTILGGVLVSNTKSGYFDLVLVDAGNSNNPGNASNLWTLPGNGDGTFGSAISTPLSNQLAWSDQNGNNNSNLYGNFTVPFADFIGDGKLHFAGVDAVNNYLWVYSLVSGTYQGTQLTTEDGGYDSCFNAAGNLSHPSGPPDLVSANCWANDITVYVNDGKGNFSPGVDHPVFGSSDGVTVADVNGDGKGDVVSVNVQSADVAVLLGDGQGGLGNELGGFVTGGRPQVPALVVKNSTSDKMDVVVPDNEWSFAYLHGNGDGTFGSDTRSGVNYYAQAGPIIGNGTRPQGFAIASGDFNGDGIPDFVIGNSNLATSAGITVFLSNPDGTFQPGVNYSNPNIANANLEYVAVADFNNDGKLDIAATDTVNGGVQIFLGNGDGTFAPPTNTAEIATDTGTYTTLGILAADFNGDGLPDIAVVNNTGAPSADVGVILNTSTGGTLSFGNPANYQIGSTQATMATEVAAGDLGTGQTDLVVPLFGTYNPPTTNVPGSQVAVLLGQGNGTFLAANGSPFTLSNGSTTYYNPYAAAIGNFGTGHPDLAITIQDETNFNQGIAVVLGIGDGTFQANPVLLPTTLQDPVADNPLPGYVKIADMNGDTIPDLVYSNGEFGTVGILYGEGLVSGQPTFYDPVEFPAGRWEFGIAVVGLNGNGAQDVVASGNSSDFSGITVLLNTGDTSTTVASSAPSGSIVGNPVTFTATVAATVKGIAGPPTGKVSFYDTSTLLGQGTLSSGQAAFQTNSLTVGSHNITAVYSGDGGANFLPSTSSPLTQIVGKASDATSTPVGSPNPAPPKQSVTFTVTVTAENSPLSPTGTVGFYDGTNKIGTGTLSSGKATFTTSSLAAGTHSITAVYGGDTDFTGSTSSAVNEVVAVPDYTLKSNPTTQTVTAGSSAKYTITLTPSTGYDGAVTFACPSSLPSGVSCSFSPNPATPTSNPAYTSVLTITTTAPSAAMIVPADVNAIHGNLNLLASLSTIGLMGLVLTGDWKKRRFSGRIVILAVIALVMVLAWAGCGGGSSSSTTPPPSGGTPAGSYPLTLTATGTPGTNGGNTSQHTLNITLTVQ